MRESICTLPVVDVFSVNDGCPICRMQETITKKIVDYILGAAMMEPDIRIETNKMGFCNKHFDMLFSHRGKLQLALILESHFDTLIKQIKNKDVKKLSSTIDDCYICNKVNWGLNLMYETICTTYEKDADFRRMFEEQDYICPSHAIELVTRANKKNMKSYHRDFSNLIFKKCLLKAETLKENVTGFTKLFDYRNSENKKEDAAFKNAPIDAIEFISKK